MYPSTSGIHLCNVFNFFHTEVTALRAKIGEMRESSMSMEQDCRERVKEEYRDLIKNLLEASGVVKNKLDEFRCVARGI